MKNNSKRIRKKKVEKRRLAFEKRNAKKEQNLVRYGAEGGSALVMAKATDFNRRLVAAFLAMVFVLTTLVVGYNVSVKATSGDQIILDDTYSIGTVTLGNYTSYSEDTGFLSNNYSDSPITITGTVSVIVENGKIANINFSTGPNNAYFSQYNQRLYKYNSRYRDSRTGRSTSYTNSEKVGEQVLNGAGEINTQLQSLIGQDATYENIASALSGASSTNSWYTGAYNPLRTAVLEMMSDAPAAPKPNVDGDDYEAPDPPPLPDSAESYLEVNKTISPSADGSAYDLTLEAYSTADISSYEIMEKVPTDYVVVIDQSGSMAYNDMPTSYKAAGNKTLEEINNGNYYINVGGKTYRVFAERGYLYKYYAPNYWYPGTIKDRLGTNLGWFMGETETTTTFQNQFYFRENGDNNKGVYHPLTLTVRGVPLTYYMTFQYTNNDGNPVFFNRNNESYINDNAPYYHNLIGGGTISPGWGVWPVNYDNIDSIVQGIYDGDQYYTYSEFNILVTELKTGMLINYPMYDRHVGYTRLCYRDDNGVIQEVPTKTGVYSTEYCDENGNAITTKDGNTRMEYAGLLEGKTYETRLDTLDTALQAFVKTLEKDIDSFGIVDNRVAIVGFSSPNTAGNNFNNTEVLSGVSLTPVPASSGSTGDSPYFPYGYNYNGPQYYAGNGNYGNINTAYGTALIDATVEGADGKYTVNPNLYTAIHALTAYGGTQPEDGLVMAKNIYDNRDETTYTMRSGNKETVQRNKVVIFFTDGQPGDYENSNRYLEANQVVNAAYDLKHYKNPGENDENPAQVFSIGVFGTSDGEALTYEAHNPTNENKAYEYDAGYYYTYDSTERTGWWSTTTTYHYLNRFWHPGEQGYPAQADDTIYDYMSVVSSRYPNATNFVDSAWDEQGTNSRTYNAMIADVRGTEDTSKNYYRLAANQESLIAAFRSAVEATTGEVTPTAGEISEDTVLKDFINTDSFVLPEHPDIEVKTLVGTKTGDQAPVFPGTEGDATGITATPNGNVITVSGFDYNDKHIATGHPGEKLVVTIRGITPKAGVTGDQLLSNTDQTGIYSDVTANADKLKSFPEPAIARYKYELNVGAADNDAKFDLNYTLAANPGTTTGFNNILIADESDTSNVRREFYSDGNLKSVNDATDGSVIYLEYMTEQGKNGEVDPADYSIAATIAPTSTDASTYTYYLDTTNFVDLTNPDPTKILPQPNGTAISTFTTTANGAMYVNSKVNNRTVIIKETVDGSFADDTDKFTPTLYLVPPEGQQVPAEGATYGGVNWEIDGTNNRLKYTTREIQGNNDDSVSLTVPANWKLIVEQTDSDYYEVTDKEYVLGTSGTSTDIPAGGVDITDNLTITITNTRDNIPITGVDDHDTYNWVIYLLAAFAGLAAIGAGIFLWKKRNEFVEE